MFKLIFFSMMLIPALASAEDCGAFLATPFMPDEDKQVFVEVATEFSVEFEILPANPASVQYFRRKGYRAKTMELSDCKTAREGRNAGLVQCPPGMFDSKDEWQRVKTKLKKFGYKVLSAAHDYLVVDGDGDAYYSDYDLNLVVDAKTGESAYSEELRQELNRRLGGRLVRHPPLEEFEDRQKVGLKFPIVRITAFGEIHIHTLADLKKFRAPFNNIPWRWN